MWMSCFFIRWINSNLHRMSKLGWVNCFFIGWVNLLQIFNIGWTTPLRHSLIISLFSLCPVVSCEPLSVPPHGWMECSGLYGNHSLNSNCKFSCAGGYKLNGTAELRCNSSGAWNAPPPSCAGAICISKLRFCVYIKMSCIM